METKKTNDTIKKRKSISKKLRFEIFKRDKFTCSYCGKTPPKVTLVIDHVTPVSKGGDSDINNYLTACQDCNQGKGARLLESIPKKLSDNMELIEEKESQILAYRKFVKTINRRINKDMRSIEKIFQETYPQEKFTKQFKRSTLQYFFKQLPKHEIENSMYIATSRVDNQFYNCIKYFCGVCWRKIRKE